MKIFLLGILSDENPLLIELALNLKNRGHEVILLDLFISKIYHFELNKIKAIEMTFFIKYILKIKYFRRLFIKKNNLKFLKDTVKPGDCINIHYCSPMYLDYIDVIKNKGGKVVSTVWGSDYLRADNITKEKLYPLFDKSDVITMVEGVRKIFTQEYPELAIKTKTTFFGLEKLESKNYSTNVVTFKRKYAISEDKLVVTIGNNGIESQQHLRVLDELDKLEKELKNRIQIVIPATYGLKKDYQVKLNSKLKDMDFSFVMLTESLSDDDIIALHKSTDICIFFQETDAFSAFLSESIYFGSVSIAGDWLPYEIFKDWGVHILFSNFNNLNKIIEICVFQPSQIKTNIDKNPENIYKQLAWRFAINRWVNVYNT